MKIQVMHHRAKSVMGFKVEQLYYPERQLYGGYVACAANIGSGVLVIQNAAIIGDAAIKDEAVIYGDAIVRGRVQIGGNARIGGKVVLEGNFSIFGNAKIESMDDFVVVGPIGARKANTVFYRMISPGMLGVTCGCYTGTMAEFSERVAKVYPPGSKLRKEYDAAIDFASKKLG